MARERSRKPDSPWFFIGIGAVVTLIGGLGLDGDQTTWLAYALLWAGGVLTSIGVIGVGVTAGLLRADWRRSRDS